MAISRKLLKTLLFWCGLISLGTFVTAGTAVCQSAAPVADVKPDTTDANASTTTNVAPQDKRVFGVLPNYRTAELTSDYHPITSKQKMHIALKDTFDYPLFALAGAYAGLYQAENSHPQFGQGAEGYFKRLGTSYTDQLIGNMLTEGILPIAFHEDPRYFRLGEGTKSKRIGYALSRIFITKTDKGNKSFNFAEVMGNGTAALVGLSYYKDSRDPADYFQNFGTQLATDAFSQVLKEFWPDIKHYYKRRHHKES